MSPVLSVKESKLLRRQESVSSNEGSEDGSKGEKNEGEKSCKIKL